MSNPSNRVLNREMGETKNMSDFLRGIIPFLGLILVFSLFAVSTDGKFIALNNLRTIFEHSIIVMIVAIGGTFVVATGNMDFGVGGELAICIIVAWYVGQFSLVLAFVAAILAGIACGTIVAVVHNKFKVSTFIVGMCIMFIGRGLATTLVQTQAMNAPASIGRMDRSAFYIVTLVIVFAIAYILFEKTKIGKYCKAIGANEKTALLSGISVSTYKWISYVISGTCVGIASVLSMAKTGGVSGTSGQGLEVNVVIAMVLGGLTLTGGTSLKLRSIVIGALIFQMLNNGLALWGADTNLSNIIKGIIFLICVYFSQDRSGNQMPT